MPNLDLEDFGGSEDKPDLDKISKEEIERFYQDKIRKIEEDFKKRLEVEIENAYKQGYNEGITKGREEFDSKLKEILEKELKEREKEYINRLTELESKIQKVVESLNSSYKNYIDHINELILSALEEMLSYLYISPENEKFLSQQIISVINEFRSYPKLKITLSPDMEHVAQMLKKENLDVSIDKTLVKGDFRINIEDIQLESNFKEKMQILKDEIKREIKKHSKI
ncbi:FliH/SctL family protein [Persephonella sp.]